MKSGIPSDLSTRNNVFVVGLLIYTTTIKFENKILVCPKVKSCGINLQKCYKL